MLIAMMDTTMDRQVGVVRALGRPPCAACAQPPRDLLVRSYHGQASKEPAVGTWPRPAGWWDLISSEGWGGWVARRGGVPGEGGALRVAAGPFVPHPAQRAALPRAGAAPSGPGAAQLRVEPGALGPRVLEHLPGHLLPARGAPVGADGPRLRAAPGRGGGLLWGAAAGG